jgi:hypothetical protein
MHYSIDQIIAIIYIAVDEINKQSPTHAHLSKELTTILLGDGGILDSLGLINLIVCIEEKIVCEIGRQVILLDEESLVNPEGPYRSVGSLATWILSKIS